MTIHKPYISILIPTYNEENYIKQCLDSLVDDFVVQNAEILVSDGRSTDKTRSIVKSYQRSHPNLSIKLISNPRRHQSFGINKAIKQARGEIIVWAGAHAVYPPSYVKKCILLSEKTGADNVGGAVYPKSKTKFQRLVALAQSHPAGVGNSRFRLGNYKGYTDTVFGGTFKKKLFDRIGYFDHYPNQDAEMNLRILRSGGEVFIDGSIKVGYYPRDTLGGVIRQYLRYGWGRCRTTLKHKKFTALRQLAPIALVLGLAASFALSLSVSPFFLLFPSVYFVSLLTIGFWVLGRFAPKDAFLLMVILASMHISWGFGFLSYLFRLTRRWGVFDEIVDRPFELVPGKLSIVILNWNSKDNLISCLSHIEKNTRLKEKEVIVVDNGSVDGSVKYIEENYPEVVLIKNERNLGVSVARNQAIKIARGEYVMLLDSDTKVGPGAIDLLVKEMGRYPKVGVIGPKLVSLNGKLQYSCREFPTVLSKFIFRRLPGKIVSKFLAKEEYRDWDHTSLAYVGYMIGACLLIRRDCTDEVGLFDEKFFYGPEDVDYCLRVWKNGWKVMYEPKAEVAHKEARITTRGSIFQRLKEPLFWAHVRGLVIYFAKHRYLFRRPGPFFSEVTDKLASRRFR